MRTIIFFFFSLFYQFSQLYCQNFTLIFPKHNEVLSDRTPILNWNNYEESTSYQISLSQDSTFITGVQQFSTSSTTLQITNNLASGIWFWKVNTNLNGQNILSNLGKFQIFEPTDIPGLVVWLSSDTLVSLDQNNRVSSWNNLVGSNHFINNNQSSRPFVSSPISSMNNKKAIDFQGLEFLASTNNFTFNNASIFLLASQQSGDGNYGRFIDHDFSSGFWIGRDGVNNAMGGGFTESSAPFGNFVNLSNNLYSLVSMIRLGSVVSSFQNSQPFPIPTRTSLSNTTASNKISLGASINQTLFGKKRIMNILIYSTNLSVTQRKLVEKYQMDKYAPPINLGADINPIYQNNGTCVNETITATNLYTNYLWSTGATSQSIQVSQPGSYWVQTTDIFGRISRDTIIVNNPKMNIFNFGEKLVCSSGFSGVLATAPTNHTFLQWSDGITVNTHDFDSSNVYNSYYFTFSNTAGCIIKSNLFSIALDTSLNSISLGLDTSICSNSLIQLTTNPQVPISYLWNTNNTNSSQLIQTSGLYWVQVTNDNGCSNSDSILVTISQEGPTVSVNIPNYSCIGSSFEITASGTITSPESIVSYSWDFGNAISGNGDTVQISYSSTGSKQIELTVLASNGCVVSLSQSHLVYANPSVNIQSNGSCLFDTISFVTNNNGSVIQNYSWNLGQNNVSNLSSPHQIYAVPGIFPISVIVTDPQGCVDTSNYQLVLSESFETYSNSISVIWPRQNEILSDRTPLLSWNGFEGVSAYQVSLSQDSTFITGVQQFSTSSTTLQITNNLASGIWFWKVNTNLNGQNILSNLGKFQIFEPTDIPGLVVWLSSDTLVSLDQNNRVSSWNNLVGSNHFINNNQSSRPFVSSPISSMNNKKAIDFQGLEFLASTNNFTFNNASIFLLASQQSGDGNYGRFIDHDFSSGFWIGRDGVNNAMGGGFTESSAPFGNFVNLSNNLYSLVSMIRLGSVVSSFQNSQPFPIPTRTSLSNTTASNKISLGASINQTLFGKKRIMNILIYSTNLSVTQRKLVEKYQMDKYAPPINLGADINPIYQNNGTCVNETITATNLYTNYLWSTGATSQSIQVSQPGSYWLQTTDIFGRTSRDTIVVNNPKMNLFSDIEYECYNGPSFIAANIPQNHAFIRWNNCNPNITNQIHTGNFYFVEFQNPQGCIIKSNLFSVSEDSSLQSITLGPDTSLCSGNNIQLQNSPADITAYSWNTGNNQATQTVDTTGQYILEVTNSNNCQNRDTINVSVVGTSPNLQFQFTDSLCQFSSGNYVDNSFVPNNNGTISNKIWSVSDGSVYTGSLGDFSLDTAGVFNVTLLVETLEGCSSSTTFPIVVFPKPILSFTNQNYCPYDAVEFNAVNSQISPFNSFQWNFGDNTTSALSNPSHVFGLSGIYNATLQAEDINGCRDTVMQEVYIQPAPFADFSFNNTCEETEVNFVNNSNIVDTFNITFNTWFYGDGTQAINPSFQKTYADADTFDVQLIVTANNGCQDTSMQSIIINPRPTLDWQVGAACKNAWTTFENFSSVSVGNIAQTDWLVNLQYPLEGTSSAYQFVTTGVQYLNLTSTTDNGCQRDTLIIVNVQPEINASYIVSPQTIVAGVPTSFTSTSTGASQFTWNLGNGNIIQTTVAEPVEATGFDASLIGDSIQTSLIIENTIGCKDTATQFIKIFEPRIDLAITQLFVQDLNGFYKVGVELSNQGFIEITQTDLVLKMYGSLPILETENESLSPGESRIYLFNASPSAYISTQDNETSYLCVEATSYNDYQLIETELSNNVACLNTEGENFVLLPIYPNPTNNDISYSFILSEEATLKTSLTDETGRIVLEQSELHTAGLHTQLLSMRNLSAGVYYFHISDGTSAKTVKILKN